VSSSSTITFYSKPDCPLCDEGLAKVQVMAGRHGLRVEKVDIAGDPRLQERHRFRIPVVEFRGVELGWGRLSERGMEKRLRELLSVG
jgi:glutaredoxin